MGVLIKAERVACHKAGRLCQRSFRSTYRAASLISRSMSCVKGTALLGPLRQRLEEFVHGSLLKEIDRRSASLAALNKLTE